MGNREAADEVEKCWATNVLAEALTAELSMGSLAAVFAIFI